MKSIFKPALSLSALFFAIHGSAQLFIDNGGPRDIFFDANVTEEGDKTIVKPFIGKFDSEEKSASFSYLGRPEFLQGGILGAKGKIEAVDDVTDFLRFKEMPRFEFSLLGNWSWKHPKDASKTTLWSLTPRASVSYAEYELVPPTGTTPRKLATEHFTSASASLTLGLVPHWGDGFALSIGVERSSNYDDLEKVEISEANATLPDGTPIEGEKRTVRLGVLEKDITYPLHVTYVHAFDITKLGRQLPTFDKKSAYDLMVAPYFKVSAGRGADSANAIGINFTLRRLSNSTGPNGEPPEGKDFNDQELSFPYAFFVEHRNVFGNGEGTTKGGVAVVFAWK